MSVCVCVHNSCSCVCVCVRACSCVCSCFGKQQRNELQMPDGVLEWNANWAATLSTRPDTMEIARTGRRQLEQQLGYFIRFLPKKKRKKKCVCVCVSASLMNTILADARLCQFGEPKERCSAPAEKRCSLISLPVSLCVSDLLFPPLFSHFLNTLLSFLAITFLHSFTRPPLPLPSLTHSQPASALSFSFILCKRGVRLMSLFLGD